MVFSGCFQTIKFFLSSGRASIISFTPLRMKSMTPIATPPAASRLSETRNPYRAKRVERLGPCGVGPGVRRLALGLGCVLLGVGGAAAAQDGGAGVHRPIDDSPGGTPFEAALEDDPIGARPDDDLRPLTERDRAEAEAR